jgi:hypothetical protein
MTADAANEFTRLIDAVLTRFFAQNSQHPPAAGERARLAANLLALIAERGLPRPLAAHETGAPGEMADGEVTALVARVLDAAADPLLAEAARQLVKACFYPEFRKCRDSFREMSPDGSCRRQELARARRRVSGAHCVDCPHWVALRPEQHEKFIAREWRVAPPGEEPASAFLAHRDVFLPEDFRALRRWLHREARSPR